MKKILEKYTNKFEEKSVNATIQQITKGIGALKTAENLKLAFGLIDLTTLNATDTDEKVLKITEKVSSFKNSYNAIPNVAAICVYPPFVSLIHKNLKDKNVKIASVGAGFPSSQTFKSIKIEECRLAKKMGANDIDIVVSLGKYISGDIEYVFKEITEIKDAIGDTHLKVILETGALQTLNDIWTTSIIAMEAGADFIKTSTGKMEPAATPEAVYIMCLAIKEFYKQTNKKIGIKPAGGIVTPDDALTYIAIVKEILGAEWLNPELFRLGASKLANNLLTEINFVETGKAEEVCYF